MRARRLPFTTISRWSNVCRTKNESTAKQRTAFHYLGIAVGLLQVLCVNPSHGQVTPTADSVIAPARFNPGGSLNATATQWNNNALQSLSQGGGTVGNPATDPSAYVPVGTIGQKDFVATFSQPGAEFPSWKGLADPPAPFNTVYGSALMFPLFLQSTTTQFRLSNLDNVVTSNDATDALGALSHGASGRNYGYNTVGVSFGPDGIPNTDDDIVYNAGESGSLPVNELFFTGIGVFLQAFDHGPSDQGDIDQSVATAFSQTPFTRISNEYLLYDDSGNLLVDVTRSVAVTPEPTASGCLGVLLLVFFRWRTRAGANKGTFLNNQHFSLFTAAVSMMRKN